MSWYSEGEVGGGHIIFAAAAGERRIIGGAVVGEGGGGHGKAVLGIKELLEARPHPVITKRKGGLQEGDDLFASVLGEEGGEHKFMKPKTGWPLPLLGLQIPKEEDLPCCHEVRRY